ncbi:MazG nucleotide pyrophosphohydrolase domain-containing protein [Halovivax cerinus]|uniref:MazG nucleotide pyrophosphohydrolase domain-containing protein n=1 Tax=Halovivax cerinus TaxID=1487865 RepID=A0ABD5NMJ3_9EURY|nr:MazG nucleotide pyrophosphohydrolase domain-containing protein [Halovivax cerinus]
MANSLQDRAVSFADTHDLDADPAYRVLDLAAEVGEIAADAAKSSAYGADPDGLTIEPDEIGDALFSVLLVAHAVDVDAEDAFERALEKYERRLDETGHPGSDG